MELNASCRCFFFRGSTFTTCNSRTTTCTAESPPSSLGIRCLPCKSWRLVLGDVLPKFVLLADFSTIFVQLEISWIYWRVSLRTWATSAVFGKVRSFKLHPKHYWGTGRSGLKKITPAKTTKKSSWSAGEAFLEG